MKLLLSLVVLLLAPVGLRAADSDPLIKLVDLKLFPDTPKGHYAKPLDGYEFSSSQKRQLAVLYFDKAGAGQPVIVRIVGARTTLGAEKEVITFKPAAIDAEGRLPVEVKFPENVPPGRYRFDVIKNDKIVGVAGYYVKASEIKKTPITAAKIDIYHRKPDGGLEVVPAAKAADHHLYFAAETKGSRTGGARVVWTFTAVDTTAGKNKELPTVDEKDWPLEDTTLVYDMELPRDWPLGKYRVSLSIDDAAVKDLDFEIKE